MKIGLNVVKVSEKLFQDNVGHGRGEIVGAPPNPPIKDITLFDVEFLCIQNKTTTKKTTICNLCCHGNRNDAMFLAIEIGLKDGSVYRKNLPSPAQLWISYMQHKRNTNAKLLFSQYFLKTS